VAYVKVCGRVIVLPFFWVIIKYYTIGVVKRALKSLAGLPFWIVLEN
jgi:hypothetical protein